MVDEGNPVTPVGYSPLAKFGEVVAFNVNNAADGGNNCQIYVYFKRVDNNKTEVTGEYISRIEVFEGSSFEEVLSKISVKGYTALQCNLNPDSEDSVAMLGYLTTPNSGMAIRDIRIAENYSVSQIHIGNSSYTKAGTYHDTTLFYSQGPESGYPILADFIVTYQIPDETPAGYEGIALISGGPAANMAIGSSLYRKDMYTSDSPKPSEMYKIFIYFKTGAEYDDNAAEYVSGINFFQSNSASIAQNMMTAYGYKSLDQDMTNSSGNHTYMGVSTTKNPYRALKRVYAYYVPDEDVILPAAIYTNGLGYTAATTFTAESDWDIITLGTRSIEYASTTLSTAANYAFISNGGNGTMYYTAGTSSGTPFTVDEIKLETSRLDTVPSGYYPVARAMDAAGGATDIKKGNKSSSDFLYMYLPGEPDVVGQYISSIVISGSRGGEDYANLELLGLSADEVLDANISGHYYIDTEKASLPYTVSTGLIHTDDINIAIRDIKLVPFGEYSGKNPPATITVNGLVYSLASKTPCGFNKEVSYIPTGGYQDTEITEYNGGAYVYVTSNPAAGDPITEIDIEGWKTTLDGYETAEYIVDVEGASSMDDLDYLCASYVRVFFKRSPPATKYIKSIYAISGGRDVWTKVNLSLHGCSDYLDCDFNDDNGGNYSFIGYSYTNDSSQAITGLLVCRISEYSDRQSTIVSNGITYTNDGNYSDFNSGSGGDYIFIYYTKDPAAGTPITSLKGNGSSNETGWLTVKETGGDNANFNAGDDHWFYTPDAIYLHYQRAQATSASVAGSVFSSGNGVFLAITAAVAIAWAAAATLTVGKWRKKQIKNK